VFLNNIVPEANNVFRNLRAGSYTLKVQDAGGCQWSAPILLQEAVKPSIELGPDREIKLGDSVRITPIISRDSIVALDWATGLTPSIPNSRNQVLKPSASTTVQVTIRAANGCTASDFVNIRVIRELPLFVPSGFSPNGDGINDLLNVFAGPQVAKVKFFRIYDRWGTQVFGLQEFKPNEALLGWDGTIGGKLLNSAVFTWYAEVEMADGKLELIKGDVTLMR
jgi:gliding motility-associated-like protein